MTGAGQQELKLNSHFEKLPQPTRDWLLDTERKINDWALKSKAFPVDNGEMRGRQQLLDETQRAAETLAEHSRLDEQTVASFKAQVDKTLSDAYMAEQEYQRSHERQVYARTAHLPTPFFEAKLRDMQVEAEVLQQHIGELDGALADGSTTITREGLQELLQRQKVMFERCASKVHSQHSQLEAHRQRLKQQLGYDPFAEAQLRRQAVRDKFKPPDRPIPLLPPAAAAAPTAAAPAAPGTTPSLTFGGGASSLFSAKPPAPASASLFGAPASATGGGLFGSTPTAPVAPTLGAATPLGAPTLGANPFTTSLTPAAPPSGSLFGPPSLGASTSAQRSNAKKKTASRK